MQTAVIKRPFHLVISLCTNMDGQHKEESYAEYVFMTEYGCWEVWDDPDDELIDDAIQNFYKIYRSRPEFIYKVCRNCQAKGIKS
jgi:hypothetical protein